MFKFHVKGLKVTKIKVWEVLKTRLLSNRIPVKAVTENLKMALKTEWIHVMRFLNHMYSCDF